MTSIVGQKGFSLIEVLLVMIIIGIIAAIAIPSLLESRRTANEATALANLKAIQTAEAAYSLTGTGTFGTFANISGAGLLDSSWTGTPTRNGYQFALTLGGGNSGFCVRANAISIGAGRRSFAVSHKNAIYQMDGQTAPACDASTGAITGDATLKVVGSN
jgi:type IV pilus assembly protein PilA